MAETENVKLVTVNLDLDMDMYTTHHALIDVCFDRAS